MSKLVNISIDVTKIPRSAIFEGKKGKYVDLDVWINDEPDQYGNDASVNIRQSKEEREAKERKTYVGNGKKVFGWDEAPQQSAPQSAPAPDDDGGDDIPF